MLSRVKASDFQTPTHILFLLLSQAQSGNEPYELSLSLHPTATSEQAPLTAQLGRCTKGLSVVSPCLSPVLQTRR